MSGCESQLIVPITWLVMSWSCAHFCDNTTVTISEPLSIRHVSSIDCANYITSHVLIFLERLTPWREACRGPQVNHSASDHVSLRTVYLTQSGLYLSHSSHCMRFIRALFKSFTTNKMQWTNQGRVYSQLIWKFFFFWGAISRIVNLDCSWIISENWHRYLHPIGPIKPEGDF